MYSHFRWRSRRYDCLLLVFFKRKGPLIARHYLYHRDRLWLVHNDLLFVPASRCSLSGSLLYCFLVVVYFDRGHPSFRNLYNTIPIYVIRVKSYVNSFLDPTCVPVRLSISKVDLFPDRIVAGHVGVFRNCGSLGKGVSYTPVMFLIHSGMEFPFFSDVEFATLPGNPAVNINLSSRVDGVLWSQ